MSEKDKLVPIGSNSMAEAVFKMVGCDCPGEVAGDYRDIEGLLVCYVCGKRKEKRMDILNLGPRVFPVLCECGEREIREQERIKQIENEQRVVDSLFRYSLIDDRFRESTFENFKANGSNVKQLKMARRYVERFDEMYKRNKGLLFHGEPSTGKTFLASCIANALLKERVPLIVTSIIKLTAASGPFSRDAEYQNDLIRGMNAARLLIIDDLGTERDTDFKAEQVFEVIDSRYNAKKPMVITTNLSLLQMQNENNIRRRRVYERIYEVCHPVEFTGSSWRWKAAEDDYDEIERLLLGE